MDGIEQLVANMGRMSTEQLQEGLRRLKDQGKIASGHVDGDNLHIRATEGGDLRYRRPAPAWLHSR